MLSRQAHHDFHEGDDSLVVDEDDEVVEAGKKIYKHEVLYH